MVKFQKHQQAAVREYWIVDPDTETVQDSILEGGRYFTTIKKNSGIFQKHFSQKK